MKRYRVKGIAFLILGFLLLGLYAGGVHPLQDRIEDYTERAIKTTLGAYVVVRGINAGVSVLKESQISLSPAGVGVSLALGQVLDPIDDITERASSVLLISFVSLGAQRIALELFSGVLLLTAGLFLILTGVLYSLQKDIPRFLRGILIALLIFRFLLPSFIAGSDLLYMSYVQPRIEEEVSRLSGLKDELLSLLEKVKSPKEFKSSLEDLTRYADTSVNSFLSISMYFLFQTVLLPVVILWLVLGVMRSIIRGRL